MAFNLNDYEPVAARLARWLADCKERGIQPRVITDLVHHDPAWCVFRCNLFEGDVLVSVGWAEERATERGVNATSHVENCETSSVGRALANAGWAGNDPAKRASQEEMRKVKVGERALQRAERPPTGPETDQGTTPPAPAPAGNNGPTEKMAKFLKVLETRSGMKADPAAFTDFEICRQEIDRLQSETK